jgi:GNAT superfamily N-acetyltransferase
MMVFAQEKLSEIRDEAMPLLLRHWQEIALNQATTPLDPDWKTYKLLEDAGALHVTTLRDHGELIGYVSFVISPNLHYRTVVVAVDDIFWLAPEHRKGLLGRRLLKAAHEAVIRAGATKIVHHHKDHLDIGPLFRSLGFTMIEHVYSKVL